MIGYVPRTFPALMIRSANANTGLLGKLGNAPALGALGDSALTSVFSSLFNGGQAASQEFDVAASQVQAAQLDAERSSNWALFGTIAVGVAGLAGVVYFLRS